jgi:hypothetical protein
MAFRDLGAQSFHCADPPTTLGPEKLQAHTLLDNRIGSPHNNWLRAHSHPSVPSGRSGLGHDKTTTTIWYGNRTVLFVGYLQELRAHEFGI